MTRHRLGGRDEREEFPFLMDIFRARAAGFSRRRLWKKRARQHCIHARRFGHDPAGRVECADPIDGLFTGAQSGELILESSGPFRVIDLGADGQNFVCEHGVVFLEGLPDGHPVKNAEAAGQQ